MKKKTNDIPRDLLEKAEAAMIDEEPVFYMDGEQRTQAQIIRIDHENPEFTFLLRFDRHTMKWVGWSKIKFEP